MKTVEEIYSNANQQLLRRTALRDALRLTRAPKPAS